MSATHFDNLPLGLTTIAGGTAGNHTVTGIKTNDKLRAVLTLDFTLTEGTPNTRTWAVSDLTSEFSISAADTINNTGGTDTSGGILLVLYLAASDNV